MTTCSPALITRASLLNSRSMLARVGRGSLPRSLPSCSERTPIRSGLTRNFSMSNLRMRITSLAGTLRCLPLGRFSYRVTPTRRAWQSWRGASVFTGFDWPSGAQAKETTREVAMSKRQIMRDLPFGLLKANLGHGTCNDTNVNAAPCGQEYFENLTHELRIIS